MGPSCVLHFSHCSKVLIQQAVAGCASAAVHMKSQNMASAGCCHAEQVCAGLEEAVQTMKLNELAEVIVQPQYGFGSQEHQLADATIPANSTLFYTVQLVELNKVPSCALALLCYSLFLPQSGLSQTPLCSSLYSL